jgi:hypothetical protein
MAALGAMATQREGGALGRRLDGRCLGRPLGAQHLGARLQHEQLVQCDPGSPGHALEFFP